MELVTEKVNQLFNPENFPPIAGHKCIARWDFISMFHGFYEIPTRVVRPLLPRGIEPVEVRPGTSLYDIGHVHWNEGNLRGQWPEFHEITVMLVHPDLSVGMPMSKVLLLRPQDRGQLPPICRERGAYVAPADRFCAMLARPSARRCRPPS
jgi:hypothetical protein